MTGKSRARDPKFLDINASMKKSMLLVCPENQMPTGLLENLKQSDMQVNFTPSLKTALPHVTNKKFDLMGITVPGVESAEFKIFKLLAENYKNKIGVFSHQLDLNLKKEVEKSFGAFYLTFPLNKNLLFDINNSRKSLIESRKRNPNFGQIFEIAKANQEHGKVKRVNKNIEEMKKETGGDPYLEDYLKRKFFSETQFRNLLDAYKACLSQFDRSWVDEDIADLFKKLSMYYLNSRLSIVTYALPTDEIRVLTDSHVHVSRDTGAGIDKVFNPMIAQHLVKIVNDFVSAETFLEPKYFNFDETKFATFPLFLTQHFFSTVIMQMDKEIEKWNKDDISFEIYKCFQLNRNLKKSIIGKQRIVELYQYYFLHQEKVERDVG